MALAVEDLAVGLDVLPQLSARGVQLGVGLRCVHPCGVQGLHNALLLADGVLVCSLLGERLTGLLKRVARALQGVAEHAA